MKAIRIMAPNQAEFVDLPRPEPGPGHALIKPLHLSLCGSDVYMLRYMTAAYYPQDPGVTGHEMIGVVTELNGEHPEVKVGDLALTLAPEQGAMAEYYVAPFDFVLPVPEGVPAEHLVQAQQLGTVIYACQRLPNVVGKSVVIIGQGSAGQWFNTMMKRMGARCIIGVDLLDHRLAVSEQFGATHTINNGREALVPVLQTILDGSLADVVIEAVGEPETINLALDLAKEDGFVLQFGVPHQDEFTYNIGKLFAKRLTLKGVVLATLEPRHESTRMALEMIAAGEVDVRPLLTHRFPFDQVLDAYALQYTREDGAIKILIDM